jgi:hypothetical protein
VTISETAKRCAEILDEVERVIVGKREVLRLVLLGILADGHMLLEDLPRPDSSSRAARRGLLPAGAHTWPPTLAGRDHRRLRRS